MDNRKPKSKLRKKRTGNTILDRDDFMIIDGKLKLTDTYYKKRGKVKPKSNAS